MDERGESTTLYSTLEVSEGATSEEIQRAYFQLVRRFPPQSHPEYYQLLNHARETLTNPRRRGEYDQTRKNGARVRVLVDQAARALERDPQKAQSLLKSAVTIAPDLPRPRQLLAQLLMRNQEYALAERQYRWLLRGTPNDETLRCKLARCLILQGQTEEAERELKELLARNEAHYDAQLLLARIYRSQERTEELIDALEQAIFMDETESFSDFNALLQLLLVYIQSDDAPGIADTAQRLLQVIPEEKCTLAADALLQTAENLLRDDKLAWGHQLLLAVQGIALPEEAPQREQLTHLLQRIGLLQEAQRIAADTLLSGALRACIDVLYRDRSSETVRESRLGSAFAQLQRELEHDPRSFLRQLSYLRSEYPLVGADQQVSLDALSQRAYQHQLEQQLSRPAPPAPAAPEPEPPARRPGFFERLIRPR